jgi:hypothetical protein
MDADGMFLLAAYVGEALDDAWAVVQDAVAIGILGIGVYGLFTGKFSGGLRVRAARFNPLRALKVPSWPTVEAVVTEVKRKAQPEMPYAIVTVMMNQNSDGLDVSFEYEVEGVKYANTFTVIVAGGFWTRVTMSTAPGEKLLVRYDPDQPDDSVPAEKTWHGWNVWAEG